MTSQVIEEGHLRTVATSGSRGPVRSGEIQHSSWFLRPRLMPEPGIHDCTGSPEGTSVKKEKPQRSYQNDSTFFPTATMIRVLPNIF